MVKCVHLIACIISFLCFGLLGRAQIHALDSVFQADLRARLSAKGRNPVREVQAYFSDGSGYHFNAAFQIAKSRIQPTSCNRVFKSASVAKPFIAVMVLQLWEEGKIALDTPITRYLSDPVFRDILRMQQRDCSKLLTPRNLLNHTAGLKDYIFDDAQFLLKLRLFPRRSYKPFDHIRRYKRHKLNAYRNSPIGTYAYSDTHYLLLACLIEARSGQSLQENLTQRIVRKANLQNTYIDVPDSGYTQAMVQHVHRRRITGVLHPSFEFGGGGFMTHTADLGRFMEALFHGKLVQAQTLDTMLAMHSNASYGLGLMRQAIPARWLGESTSDTFMVYGHTGYYGIEMMYIPARKVCWVYAKGQSHTNRHARNLPLGLSWLKYYAYYHRPK